MLTIGSLFSGIGGLELGLERTGGFKTIWQCEVDDYASAVLRKHWPGVPNLGNITKVEWDKVEKPDLICGGFPCQDISNAGKKAGIKEGTRSGLWFEFHKAICALRPRYALIENVSAITNNGLHIVLAGLAEAGYNAEWFTLQAAEVEAPHRRERLFIVSRRQPQSLIPDTDNNRCFYGQTKVKPTEDGKYAQRDTSASRTNVSNTESARFTGGIIGSAQEQSRRSYTRNTQHGGWWAVEPNVGRVANGVPSRVDRIKCLGNAVVPQVAQVIGEAIIEAEGIKC